MFSQEYHGTIFNVCYGASENQLKENNRGHIVTTVDHFDLISEDWKEKIETIYTSDINMSIFRKSRTAMCIGTKSNVLHYYDMKPRTSDKLCEALKPVMEIPEPEVKYLSTTNILPTFNISDGNKISEIHLKTVDRCNELLSILSSTSERNTLLKKPSSKHESFVDIFTCGLRLRYNSFDSDKSSNFAQEILRQMIRIWLLGISRAAYSMNKSNDPNYYSKLISNCIATISKIAKVLSIDIEDLTNAAKITLENGIINPLILEANKVAQQNQAFLENAFKNDPSQNQQYVYYVINIVIIAYAAEIVGLHQYDIQKLAEKFVDLTRAIVHKTNISDVGKIFEEEKQTFQMELLRYLDGERYEHDFQYIYCVWDLNAPAANHPNK